MKLLVLASLALRRDAGNGGKGAGPRRGRAVIPQMQPLPFGRRGREETRSGRCSMALTAASPAPSADYSYSDANKKAEITWGEATFKDYIQNPMAKVPGTKMAFAGIKNEKEIGDLWAYLKQFKADGSK